VLNNLHISTEYFERLSKYHNDICFRTIQIGSIHQQIAFSDSRMAIIPYLFSRDTLESPLIEARSGTILFDALQQEFESVWKANEIFA
jgi:hypothetical protein